MRGIHHQPDKQEIEITSVAPDSSLAEVEGPARTLTDHQRLEELAELNGLTKEEVLRGATFDDAGRLIALNLRNAMVSDVSALNGVDPTVV